MLPTPVLFAPAVASAGIGLVLLVIPARASRLFDKLDRWAWKHRTSDFGARWKREMRQVFRPGDPADGAPVVRLLGWVFVCQTVVLALFPFVLKALPATLR